MTFSSGVAQPRRLVTAVLVALSLLLGGLVATASEALNPRPAAAAGVCDTSAYSCWMAQDAFRIGQRPLNQLIQPGSHDTGTYGIRDYASFARTQDISVYDQLALGVRSFDIRAHPRTLNGKTEMYAFHGSVDTDVKLDKMLGDVVSYTNSPGASKEIIYLKVTTDKGEGGQTLIDSCNAWAPRLASLQLTPKMLYSGRDGDQMKSMSEIWALPGSPRLILQWPGCNGYNPVLSQDWSKNGDYYANQGNTPCTKYAITKALEGRWSGTESRTSGQDIPYSYQQGNPCWNYSNAPAGTNPMTKLDTQVSGLYTLYIQQTGLVPSGPLALAVQSDVLTMLRDYWDRNVGSAWANLNYVSADFVKDDPNAAVKTDLIRRTVDLNVEANPAILTRTDTSAADPTKWRTAYTCRSRSAFTGSPKVTAWSNNDGQPALDAVQVSGSEVNVPSSGSYVLRCTDANGRRARLVQNNRLSTVGIVNQTAVADLDQLPTPAAVRLTDAFGAPLSGQKVSFIVTGPGRLTADGKTSVVATTDDDGRASTPVYLTHALGQISVRSTSVAAQQQLASATVVAGLPAALGATSGDQQSTRQGTTFANPVVVTLKDRWGNPVAGQDVVFRVESGPASFSGAASTTVRTAADGGAATTVQAGGTGGDVAISATAGNLRATFELEVVIIVQGPGPSKPTADTSVELKAPRSIKLGSTATIRVSVVNAGPETSGSWSARVVVGPKLVITSTSLGAASGSSVQLAGNGVAPDDAVDLTVTVRALHRGQVGYTALVSSDSTDPDDQNDAEVKVLKVT